MATDQSDSSEGVSSGPPPSHEASWAARVGRPVVASVALALSAVPAFLVADLFLVAVPEKAPPLGLAGLLVALGLLLTAAGLVGLAQAPLLAVARPLAGRPDLLRRILAGAAVGIPALALVGLPLATMAQRVESEALRRTVQAVLLVGAGGGAVVAGLLGAALFEALWRRLAWLRRLGPLVALLALGGALAWAILQWLHFGRELPAVLAFPAAVVFLALEGAVLLAHGTLRCVQRAGRALMTRRVMALVVLVLPLVGLGLAQSAAALDPSGATTLVARNGVSAQLLDGARRLLDRDGDGTASLLAGGDCDDGDPSRHPLAPDLPDNGRDEDCDGADRHVAEEPGSAAYLRAPLETPRRYNILFVCIEALRADHVGFGGYERRTTPRLDAFAAKSWYFENAVSASSTTRESLPALFTGRYPSGIRWIPKGKVYPIAPEQKLLTDHLKALGYWNGALVTKWLVDYLPSFNRSYDRYGMPFGNETWIRFGQESTPLTVFRAVDILAERDRERPFFLFLHIGAPHFPYVRHEGVATFGAKPLDLYDHEILYSDMALGFLLDYLKNEKLLDDTIVVLFGDHGEEFQEHGGAQHSATVHGESVHVPLVVRVPGTKPARVKQRVSLVDVFPTLFDLIGARPVDAPPQGLSLLHYVTPGVTPPERPIFSEIMVNHQGPLKFRKAIYEGDWKLVWDVTAETQALYDLRADPKEKKPVADPARADALLEKLKAFTSAGHDS